MPRFFASILAFSVLIGRKIGTQSFKSSPFVNKPIFRLFSDEEDLAVENQFYAWPRKSLGQCALEEAYAETSVTPRRNCSASKAGLKFIRMACFRNYLWTRDCVLRCYENGAIVNRNLNQADSCFARQNRDRKVSSAKPYSARPNTPPWKSGR